MAGCTARQGGRHGGGLGAYCVRAGGHSGRHSYPRRKHAKTRCRGKAVAGLMPCGQNSGHRGAHTWAGPWAV